MITATIIAPKLTPSALERLGVLGNALIDELRFEAPIQAELFGGNGMRIAAFTVNEEGYEFFAGIEQAWNASGRGASLVLVDATGRVAEVWLLIGAGGRVQ